MQPLTSGPRMHLTSAQVLAAVHSPAPKISHGIDCWQAGETVTAPKVDWDAGNRVSYSYRATDQLGMPVARRAQTRRTGSLTLIDPPDPISLASYTFRPWTEMIDPKSGAPVRFHRGVYRAHAVPPISDNGKQRSVTLSLIDITSIIDQPTAAGTVIPAATNRVTWAATKVAALTQKQLHVTQSSTVTGSPIVFEAGTSWLEIINVMLEGAGYGPVYADDEGLYRSDPLSIQATKGAEWAYGPDSGRIVSASALTPLRDRIANVARFVARTPEQGKSGVEERRNETVGPLSIATAGERVEVVDVEADTQTVLSGIADAQAPRIFAGGGLRLEGHVAINPLHADRDICSVARPRLGLSGLWELVEWTQPLQTPSSAAAVRMSMVWEAQT